MGALKTTSCCRITVAGKILPSPSGLQTRSSVSPVSVCSDMTNVWACKCAALQPGFVAAMRALYEHFLPGITPMLSSLARIHCVVVTRDKLKAAGRLPT